LDFEVVIDVDNGVTVVRPRGDIDAATSPTLALALSRLLADGAADADTVVLDLTDVDTIDPDRAWVIDEASRWFRARGRDLEIRQPTTTARAS
jgi:anti-anti-sigma factor